MGMDQNRGKGRSCKGQNYYNIFASRMREHSDAASGVLSEAKSRRDYKKSPLLMKRAMCHDEL